MPKCRKKCQILKKTIYIGLKKLEESIKIKILFKLPRIDMEMFEVGKNCKKSLKKSPKICLLNDKKEQKFKT
jgi:hypothetical protein